MVQKGNNLTTTLLAIRTQAEKDLDDTKGYPPGNPVMHGAELNYSAEVVLRLTKALEIAIRQRDEITEHPYDTDVEDHEILAALEGEK